MIKNAYSKVKPNRDYFAMIYCRLITHTIMEGDTLYLLARRYNTTVPAITLMNPGINPYNLQVGTRLRICMGEDEMKPQKPQISERELWEDMRRAFMGQGNWTKMFMDSVVFENPNSEVTRNRMMQSPEEMAAVFGMYLPREASEQLLELMNEHTALTAEMFEDEKAEMLKVPKEKRKGCMTIWRKLPAFKR